MWKVSDSLGILYRPQRYKKFFEDQNWNSMGGELDLMPIN